MFYVWKFNADKFNEYQTKVKAGEDPKKVLNDLAINRYCCRRMLLTTVETIQQVIPFYESIQEKKRRS
jgi:DNA-directed RNA polymerase, subunit N (EC 2.7.7.6)